MKIVARSILVAAAGSVVAAFAACSPMAMFSTPGAGVATSSSGPSHAPATEAQWTAAEGRAHDLAKLAGAAAFAPPMRVAERGVVATRHIDMAAGHCYHIGVAWSFDAALSFGVSFDNGTDASLGGFQRRFSGSDGSIDVCADKTGGATLTFGSVPRSGAMVNGELLEYAVVVGSSVETRGARVARRALEVKQGREAHETEVAQEHLAAQAKVDDEKRLCHECHERFEMCSSGDCRRDFFVCSNGNDYGKADDVDSRPCGTP